MPLLQYRCERCHKEFERIVKCYTDEVLCPDCGAKAVRSYCGAMYSQTGKPPKHCSGNCKTCSGCR